MTVERSPPSHGPFAGAVVPGGHRRRRPPRRAGAARRDPGWYGDHDIAVARYTSREFHELEKRLLWSRVWQMACRLEEIPEVGDTTLYEICDKSVLIVRSGPDEVRAFWNSCRHRGRQLITDPGFVQQLRCPFHGFTWNLDGSLAYVPSRWDFPQIEDDRLGLGALRVGTWAGFVFVNPDPDVRGPRDVPRRAGRPLRRLDARGPLHRGPRDQGVPGQLEGRPGGLHGGPPRRPRPIPRCSAGWATSTGSTTATSTSAGA